VGWVPRWARPKKGGEKGVKIKIFGPVFRGLSPEIDPGTPPRSTGRLPDINVHQKSAPETNSKAISQKNPKKDKKIQKNPLKAVKRFFLIFYDF